MRHYKFLSIWAAAALIGLSGCEKESFFNTDDGEGQLNCRSLSVDYINSGRETRAGVNVGDFTVDFINESNTVVKSFLYSEMPEVVSLPVGEYTIHAEYGDNPDAEWDAPYYIGESKNKFTIQAGKITDNVDPVECELSNIRVRVNIDDLGLGIVGNDAKVVVRAGDSGSLTFDKTTADKSGYFKYVTDSRTLTATFSGTVDGVYVDAITRAYDDVAKGNSYVINFTISRPDELEPGDIQIGDDDNDGIHVDASVNVKDENIVIDPDDPGQDDELVDDMRPVEDPSTPGGGEEPGGGDEPETPVVKGPKIEIKSEGLELNKQCNVDKLIVGQDDDGNPKYYLAFNVVSEAEGGLTEFKIVIDSTTLTPEELENVELSDELDLINPGDLKEALEGLGFPTEENVAGKSLCEFDISQFIPLLNMLGSGVHSFNLTVTDANGTTTGAIIIEN